jgi:hypothetical protein
VRQHPVVLAFIVRHVLNGAVEGAHQGYRTTRSELGDLVPPHVIAAVLGDFRDWAMPCPEFGAGLYVCLV